MSGDEVVAECLRLLGRAAAAGGSVRRLAGAGSGSAVYRLLTGGEDAVLKVTVAGEWREKARREVSFYRSLGGRLPVRVPRLFGSADTGGLTCLLVAGVRPLPPPAQWDLARWLEVAGQLGRLHATSVGDEPWLRPVAAPDPAAVGPAVEFWRRVGRGRPAEGLLGRLDELGAAVAGLPRCLVHGDCHAANLLTDDVGLVWVDWQEVGFGYGVEDLALLWQRSDVDGGRAPRTEMLAAYAGARGIPDDGVLRRAAIAAELLLLLLAWPGFLARAEPARRAVLVEHLGRLAERWEAA